METFHQNKDGLFGFFFIMGIVGLLIFVHVTSTQNNRCEKKSNSIILIKLI